MKRSGYVTIILSRFFAFFCPLKSFRVTQIQWFQKPLSLLKKKFFFGLSENRVSPNPWVSQLTTFRESDFWGVPHSSGVVGHQVRHPNLELLIYLSPTIFSGLCKRIRHLNNR